MSELQEILTGKREDVLRIAAKHGAYNVRIFGSVARGEATPESDIDLLIEKGPTTTPWFPAGLVLELEESLGRRVDVVTEKALNPYLRDRVLREAVPL
ncbi:MAG: nucleotidyltransferase family protein [Nitrospirota bacterium]|nr:nucleotidyltransferase family protein [Nitrospirota bacterium]